MANATDTTIVWHRRDLRVHDNAALAQASGTTERVVPVFVIDPHFFSGNYCNDARLSFLLKSLEALDRSYRELGTSLVILHGSPLEELVKLQAELQAQVFFNHDTNGSYGMQRDREAEQKHGFIGHSNDAIQRQGRSDDWSQQAQRYFADDEHPTPDTLQPHTLESDITLEHVRSRYQVHPRKDTPERGGEQEGVQRLEEFVKALPQYTKAISSPFRAERFTSRMSTHYSFGTVSLQRAFHRVKQSKHKQKGAYITRLFWNQHFTQKLNDLPTLDSEAANPYFETVYDELYDPDEAVQRAWQRGETGYPMVDAAMRALVQTGFINFRMRAMVASFYTYILRQPWKSGADFMFYHLLDADRAINYSQWQMQSGMVGVHPNRIYNPTKQIVDNDPDCKFIHKYIPELRSVAPHQLKEDPADRQQALFDYTYHKPIVSFAERAAQARELYAKHTKIAFRKVQRDPALKRRLSLSGRAKRREQEDSTPDTKLV